MFDMACFIQHVLVWSIKTKPKNNNNNKKFFGLAIPWYPLYLEIQCKYHSKCI